jgi:regulator of extracellular matrix RemA (YlzA/DUF370 family)
VSVRNAGVAAKSDDVYVSALTPVTLANKIALAKRRSQNENRFGKQGLISQLNE